MRSGSSSAQAAAGKPRCGVSWPRGSGGWISFLDESGCAPGFNLIDNSMLDNGTVGAGGGYGGIYCLALTP